MVSDSVTPRKKTEQSKFNVSDSWSMIGGSQRVLFVTPKFDLEEEDSEILAQLNVD